MSGYRESRSAWSSYRRDLCRSATRRICPLLALGPSGLSWILQTRTSTTFRCSNQEGCRNIVASYFGTANGDVSCHPATLAFEPTSKRRKGFPSEQRVKKGLRVVHAVKELIRKNLAATICAHVAPGGCFKNCCLCTGDFDGSQRHHYFR